MSTPGKVKFYREPNGDRRWRVVSRNGRTQSGSSEGYTKARGATACAVDTAVAILSDPKLGPMVRKRLGLPA